jgi:putative ABC transport system substrate-binding protein
VLAVALAAIVLALPLASEAQPTTKVWRIGYLGYAYPTEARDLEAFRQHLRELGYVEGKNLVIESRLTESSFERLPVVVAELVSLKLDVIAAYGNQTIEELRRATQTIPIVMIVAGDPVGAGLVTSLAHPGGNVTGLSSLSEGLSAKRLELLAQTVPGMTRVACSWFRTYPFTQRSCGRSRRRGCGSASPSSGRKSAGATRSSARSPRSRKRARRASSCCPIPSR